jgi:hypothetical protein
LINNALHTEYRIHNMVKTVKLSIAKTGELKQSVGRAGEEFVCAHIPCQTCGIRKWYNLNKKNPNFPGVDLKCMHCGGYAQVKTGKHQLTPHSLRFNSSHRLENTDLPCNKHNARYIYVLYDTKCRVTEVCVSEVLTFKNLFHTENCIVSYDLHHWTPAMLKKI